MDIKTIYAFIADQGVSKSALSTIKNALQDIDATTWIRGYTECLRHGRRRRMAQSMRRDEAVKSFLDYISDKTYGGKVEEKTK